MLHESSELDVVSDYATLDDPFESGLDSFYEALIPEVHQTDSSDSPPEYTKGEAGARVLQVDLVVLWDVVSLRSRLVVDGDARPTVGGHRRGVLYLQKVIGIPTYFV